MKKNKLMIAVICLIALALVGVGFVLYKNSNKKDNNPVVEQEDDYMKHINDPSIYENGAIGVGFIVR